MTTDDDSEQNGLEPAVQKEGVIETGESHGTKTIRAAKDGYWADLEVEYTWFPTGRLFTVETQRFRASGNGRNEGNIKLKLVSDGAGDTGWDELTKNATQDDEWHSFVHSRSVAGNAKDAVIHFNFIYDRKNVGDVSMTGQVRVEHIVPAPFIDPIRNVSARSVVVTGGGALYAHGAAVFVRTSVSADPSEARVTFGGIWNATVNLTPDGRHMTIDAYQVVSGKPSENSLGQHIFLAYISAPDANTVMVTGDSFRGFGAPGSKVKVVKRDNQSFQLAAETTIGANDSWASPLNVALPSGPVAVVAIFELTGFPRVVSAPVTYNVLGAPAITGPAANSIQAQTFNLSGNNALKGATVTVYRDPSETSVGHTLVTQDNGSWSADVTVAAGPTSLAALQTLNGKDSGRSSPRAFKIKPPKLFDIQVTYPRPGTAKFSGAGHAGATVDVHKTGVNDPQVSTGVSGGQWAVEWSDQPPGSYSVDIRQKLPDGSAWIHSDWSDRLTVTIPVPTPTLEVQVGGDRKPVFSGIGHSWTGQPAAQIEVLRVGESTPAVPTVEVANNRWSSAATEAWNPGTYSVEARQLFNNLSSEPTSKQFVIRAPVPTVEVRQDGLTPRFSGTCLNGAQVQLQFDGDSNSPYAAQVNGATWSFTRQEPFMPGTYTARVTQSFGGQTSDEVSQPFEVVVLRPVITSPVNDEEVDHNPIIQGTGGIPGALMRVFDFVSETLLGEAEVTDNEWSVPLTEDLAFGDQKVYAVQQYGDFPSEDSEPVSFKVILFPPTIDHPQPGDAIARVSVIDGYARKVSGLDTATVELWLDGADEPLARVPARGNDGYWFYDAHLPVGTYTLRAKQFFKDKDSDFSPDHAFTAVPAIPVIESPALQQHLGATVTISGHGYTGDWVEVAWSDAPDTVLGRVQVQANRTWSMPLAIERPAGPHSLIVQQECDGYSSGWSATHEVLLLSAAPTFTTPEAGHWFAGTAFFEGTGESGKHVEVSHWFDARQVIAPDLAVADGTWAGSPREPLTPGPHWVKARQAGSDWGESPRFDVAQEL
ncbi:Ig-like domain-containing protein [Pseudomonas mediterranea]|uniref:IPT/TIG domain-containing protein n=1 Tax=Pseudomonas mediterranea TaxID=183795 RepID=A0AAX2D9H4_9PSED|nr:hypothetical protein [Pseudomonas mediterranea]CAH0141434.1 hypothetical protein SRABI112_00457 [Pseudomonas mediterranea]SDU39087.1 hypothetical protein SAMN05216476_1812 [Pseudomonas mediterranea]